MGFLIPDEPPGPSEEQLERERKEQERLEKEREEAEREAERARQQRISRRKSLRSRQRGRLSLISGSELGARDKLG